MIFKGVFIYTQGKFIIKKISKRGQFTSVSLPTYITKEIDQLLENDPAFRYSSRANFIVSLIRKELEKYQNNIKEK